MGSSCIDTPISFVVYCHSEQMPMPSRYDTLCVYFVPNVRFLYFVVWSRFIFSTSIMDIATLRPSYWQYDPCRTLNLTVSGVTYTKWISNTRSPCLEYLVVALIRLQHQLQHGCITKLRQLYYKLLVSITLHRTDWRGFCLHGGQNFWCSTSHKLQTQYFAILCCLSTATFHMFNRTSCTNTWGVTWLSMC